MKCRVAVIIPAKNEEENIAQCLESLFNQTYPVDLILVVNDGSTDNTELILQKLQDQYPNLTYITNTVPRLKAGAINQGLETLKRYGNFQFVLIGDADTYFYPDVVEKGIAILEKDPEIGGVCSISAPTPLQGPQNWLVRLLYRLQKLEYGEFTAERTRTWRKVLIMPGLCSLFRISALLDVGGYTEGLLLEDYDITLKLKEHGWKTVFSPAIKAETQIPLTLKQLIRQRIRWFRGGLEILQLHGINKFTWSDFAEHLLFGFLLLLIVSVTFGSIVLLRGQHPLVKFSPTSLPAIVSFLLASITIMESFYKLRSLHKKDRVDVLIKALILPELFYSFIVYFCVRLYSYFLFFFPKTKKW